ncbi:substrate-binding periplasmic protein [Marinomonas algarum]|uniref:Transporter substrate-binding domain-containing protein n=1 Tax=Marinomonas algarum TaxID=2883105 RepID=A0A9X1LEZ3_9GAMM|nr:transporter substrate-binding domain-containing protein [Marinomonas algarum]MCB5162326.1 transporter substrate-binding domain-containing protein [Marinomonas algarum]
MRVSLKRAAVVVIFFGTSFLAPGLGLALAQESTPSSVSSSGALSSGALSPDAFSLGDLSTMTVRVCGNSAYPPVSWVNAERQATGVNVAVIKQLLEPLGVTVDTYQDSNWRRCLKEVELGNIDMLSGFDTASRRASMTFLTEPLVREDIYLYYPIDQPLTFKGWDALAGLRVGVLMGDSFGDAIDDALETYPTLEYVSTQAQNLRKLANRRLDAVPMGKLSGQLDLQRLGLLGKTGHVQTDVTDFWYLAISNRSPLLPWVPFLNQRLSALLASPDTIPELLSRYHTLYLRDVGLKDRHQREP